MFSERKCGPKTLRTCTLTWKIWAYVGRHEFRTIKFHLNTIAAIGNKSVSLTDTSIRSFRAAWGFLAMADRMVWPPSSSRDRKWARVTKCTHSRVVGLRLEGNLCWLIVFTALHAMQTRYSDENSVRLSVCRTRGLWQYGRKICPDFYTIRKII